MRLFQGVLLVALVTARLYGDSLSFTLDPTFEAVQAGTSPPFSVDFSGTLTDTDTEDTCDSEFSNCLYLNFISFSFDQDQSVSHLSGDPTDFYLANNQIGFLSDDSTDLGLYDTYTGNIFGIIVEPDTPVGVYTGSVTISGGYDDPNPPSLNTQLATASWTLVVAPEPADFGLAIIGLVAIVLARRRVAT